MAAPSMSRRRLTRRQLLHKSAALAAGTAAGLGRHGTVWSAAPRGLRIATHQDISQLDPMWTNDTPPAAVYDQIFDRLLVPDPRMRPVPVLAERYTASPDS